MTPVSSPSEIKPGVHPNLYTANFYLWEIYQYILKLQLPLETHPRPCYKATILVVLPGWMDLFGSCVSAVCQAGLHSIFLYSLPNEQRVQETNTWNCILLLLLTLLIKSSNTTLDKNSNITNIMYFYLSYPPSGNYYITSGVFSWFF